MKIKRTVVISLGGSIVVPEVGFIDYKFLKKFKKVILKYTKKGVRFIIVVGGGKTCRLYQAAAKKVGKLVSEDIDWIGIHSTRLNAHLLRTIFREHTHPEINMNPSIIFAFKEPILIGSGWRPGWSTDYDAAKLAIAYGAKEVINLSNIDYVFNKDPKKYKDAKKFKNINWKNFFGLVGDEWTPGANLPFDPVASRLARGSHLKVLIMKGTDVKNFDNYLLSGKFKGTIIED
ncbi:MAG: UMP kinase [Patescibacteria group bacterium]|jgi:uridylate kinase